MTIRFDGKVAIVTGAGNGLGRCHALALAARGAHVVVNDLGGARDGSGKSSEDAEAVVAEIRAGGGSAIASGASVTDEAQIAAMVDAAMAKWGKVDILVNNAGILRDKSFAKMSIEDFRAVVDVHLTGAVVCTKAVWDIMRKQRSGRVIFTSSSSGLYGNFGQANYGAAKAALVGLMNVLHLEGARDNISVCTLAPTAATRMTEDIIPPDVLALMTVESVSAALLYLASDEAPSRLILGAGAGGYAATRVFETEGIYLAPAEQTPEAIAAHIDAILDTEGQEMLEQGAQQTMKYVGKAAAALGITLGVSS